MKGSTTPAKPSIGYWAAVSIGVGGMVGGGIFAVLGLAVKLAHGATFIAFLIAGIIVLITSYSYSKLSIKYPSRGGTVEFLNQAFGTGLFSGGLNILLWLSYVIMLSLYSYAFGSYGATFFPADVQHIWKHVLICAGIILLTGLNVVGAEAVGKAEEWIVGFKLFILMLFIGVGIKYVVLARLSPSNWASPLTVIAGGMIIFLAYEGFELIANTAEDIVNPKSTLPKAYFSAAVFVILLYVLVSIVTVGNLPVKQIVEAKDYALAAAAKPFLGQFGFVLISIAAILSTGSAINATLYGASKVSYIIAKDGELPKELDNNIWNRPIEGLLITAALTLIVANFFNISSISTMGSSGFLIIFAAVNLANAYLSDKTDSKKWIPVLGTIVCIGALATLLWHTAVTSPMRLIILFVMAGISFAIEYIYQKTTGRIRKSIIRKPSD